MSAFNTFIFENLRFVDNLGDNTSLYIYPPSHKLYVVKKLSPEYRDYYDTILRIDNPSLAKILYIHQFDNSISIVREYISGDSLAELLKGGKTLSEPIATRIAITICKGLSELHKHKLVHRDINPNNIIISSDGNAKIIDYGIVRSFEKNKSSDTVILGTPGYAAPEQFGFSQSNERTDVYAVGVLLNVMLTGKLPNETHARGALGKVVTNCTHIDADKRYADMHQLEVALSGLNQTVGTADKIIEAIPGLRSKHEPIVILSIFLYTFAFFFIACMYYSAHKNNYSYISTTIAVILIFPVPVCCFGNPLNLWDKIPFTANSSHRSQKIIFYLAGFFSIVIGLSFFAV